MNTQTSNTINRAVCQSLVKPKKKALLERFVDVIGFTDNEPKIVNLTSLLENYPEFSLGNGGSWCRRSACKNFKVATMKTNGKISYLWNVTDEEKEKIDTLFLSPEYPTSSRGNNIQYIGVFGHKSSDEERPIRKDIKMFYLKQPCCVCGSKSDLVCDHKNDLYNDERVLSVDTQSISDFQSLCNHCNLQKRQISKWSKKNSKRYGATNIPSLAIFGIDFITGNETFDVKDKNAMVGTYWYDPTAFMKHVRDSFLSQQ